MFMTRAELARLMHPRVVDAGDPPTMPCCAEAQADGVPCDTVHADCECCGRAPAREAREAEPERPH